MPSSSVISPSVAPISVVSAASVVVLTMHEQLPPVLCLTAAITATITVSTVPQAGVQDRSSPGRDALAELLSTCQLEA